MADDVTFDLVLDHGRCLGLRIPSTSDALEALAAEALVPGERAHAATLGLVRRSTWVAGRVALRRALALAGLEVPQAIGIDDRGAPVLPVGIVGSVSHKAELAVALVAREDTARIGVDVENDRPGKTDIARQVLTGDEQAELAHLSASDRAREVLLRFSAKEAIYKALDPWVRRYVAFREVDLTPLPDGTARVTVRLREGAFACDVRWRRLPGLVLTTAKITGRSP